MDLLFYQRLVPLDRVRHANLKLVPADGPDASCVNSVPLLASELPHAARSFPVLFTKVADESAMPVALLGLRPGQNLFSGAGWEAGRHLPAFIRRYPFVLDTEQKVLMDESYAGFSYTDGVPLFVEGGVDGPALAHALTFLRGFQNDLEDTRVFMAELRELDLLRPSRIDVSPVDRDAFALDNVMIVDGGRVEALHDADLLRLARSGTLARIHAHLLSLGWLDELNRRRAAREADSESTVPGATADAEPNNADLDAIVSSSTGAQQTMEDQR